MSSALLLALVVTFGERPIWVFFSDKPQSSNEALTVRAGELSPRALQRRLQSREDWGVDERDLAVHQPYIDQVLASGARLRARSRWLNAVSVDATEQQWRHIEALTFVESTRPVTRRLRLPEQSDELKDRTDGQLDLMEIPLLHACGLTGSGVTIGILDTGFVLDHRALSHVDVVAQHDFVNDDDIVANEPGDPSGQHDHGTKVLSLIAGYDPGEYTGAAPDVSVILAKVDHLPTDEPVEDDWWVAGIEWVESLGADLATNSLGFCAGCPAETMDGQTEAVTIAATTAVQNGLIIFTSAGNLGPSAMTLNAPADADGVITVGNVDLAGVVAWDSSRGPTWDGRTKPDICAPGVNVWSVNPSSTDQYERGSGTSFATPLAAGLAALLLQADPTSSPTEVHQRLTSTASAADSPDNNCGWGVVSGAAAGPALCRCSDDDADSFRASSCGGLDCDDGNDAIHPEAEEVCGNNIDEDCDGEPTDCEEEEEETSDEGCGCTQTGLSVVGLGALLTALRARARSCRSRRRGHPPR